jgi:hypothetical protein
MKHKLLIFVCSISLLIAMPVYASDTSEKPIVIKGLWIGMGAAEAKTAIDLALLNKSWSASAIDTRYRFLIDYKPGIGGDEDVFGTGYGTDKIGVKGILIKTKHGYFGGYISIDESDNKITQIIFGSRLTNDLFATEKITPDDFTYAFQKYYGLPDFNWVPGGWRYASPNNYVIQITTQKMIDIKKEFVPPRPIINFN